MIDIAWSEFLLIAVIALILIGPEELPSVLRNMGRWIGKARAFGKNLSDQLELHIHHEDSTPNLKTSQPIVQNNEPREKDPPSLENKKS